MSLEDEVISARLKGRLLVRSDVASLEVSEGGAYSRLAIADPCFLEKLRGVVSCYLGGEYLYCDDVSVLAKVVAVDGVPVIAAVDSFLLFRDGEEYAF